MQLSPDLQNTLRADADRAEHKWTEETLISLISNGEKESLVLEFKACDALAPTDAKRNEVSKDIAAFANSAGGTVIYGIREIGHTATALDEGYDPNLISKEWLEQVINSRIQRRIDGIRIHPVHLATSSPGRFVYVVEVPQSARAPHQSSDKRFYKRFNFSSVPMEEYEVRDISNRTQSPELEVAFGLRPLGLPKLVNSNPPRPFGLDISPSIFNTSPTPAEYAIIHLYIDSRLALPSGYQGMVRLGELAFDIGGSTYLCQNFQMNWGGPNKMPIFGAVRMRVLDSGVLNIEPPEFGTYLLGWKLLSPGMTDKTQVFMLEVSETKSSITPCTNATLLYSMN